VTLISNFLHSHAREIIRLARNVEALERHEHPLQRTMAIDDTADRIVITTTGSRLPQRPGHAIVNAYKGHIEPALQRGQLLRAPQLAPRRLSACLLVR